MACRTATLGGHIQRCPEGHVEGIWYNSCKHRACPQCASIQIERWLERQKERLLACDHYHVIFTLPHELQGLWLKNVRCMAGWLFRCARDTVIELLGDEKYLGAVPGIVASLHTWGRNLILHPHLHCLVTGGGVDAGGGWRGIENGYLLPVRVVKAMFRGKFLDALRRGQRRGELRLPGSLPEHKFRSLLNKLGRKSWNVRLQERYSHGSGVMTYLARYVKGGPICNRQLLHNDEHSVSFRYTDHRDGRSKTMKLTPEQFLQRLFWHVCCCSGYFIGGFSN